MPVDLTALPTPCLILDLAKVDANIAGMNQHLAGKNVQLRPHVKTCKSVDVARRFFPESNGLGPITVSTLREAEYFAEAGYRDILYAVSIVADKLPRIQKIMQTGARVQVILDHPETVRALNSAAVGQGLSLPVLLELDCDAHRAGVSTDDRERILAVAGLIAAAPALEFSGIMTHAGESYVCRSTAEIQAAAAHEQQSISQAADWIEASVAPCRIRSIGSTPTALFGGSFAGITEVRAGVYVFQDLFQSNLGVCQVSDIALSVLCTVISHQPQRNWLITDAGAMALSKDRGTANQKIDYGFGVVADESGLPLDGYLVDAANQEHGIISNHAGPVDYERFPIGSRLRIIPNHACMTAAAYNCYHVIDGAQLKVWPRVNGW